MENRDRGENRGRRTVGIIGGGDIGAVVLWGGAMAVAGVVAAFAVKRRFGWWKDSREAKAKNEKTEEQKRVVDSKMNVKQIDSVDLVSALLGEKLKDKEDVAKDRSTTAHHQDIVPIINYAIPTHPEITLNPDIQEIIPFSKLKPEFIACIVEECKPLVIDKADPPVPLKDILKPIVSHSNPQPEPSLSPITEVDEKKDDNEGEDGESSSIYNDEAIWPAEMIEELSRELKEMEIPLERPEEEQKWRIIDKTKKNVIFDQNQKDGIEVTNEEQGGVTVKGKVLRFRTRTSMAVFVLLLLVVLIFRFDVVSRVFKET